MFRGDVFLAPQIRGHATPRILELLERRGFHVHRVGRAAYVHGDAHHLILGVWDRGAPEPVWERRLGAASAGYRRRIDRMASEQRWRRQHRDPDGRFGALRPWHRWPVPAIYSFEPSRPSPCEVDEATVARHNHEVRLRQRLVAPSELELRAMDGDR